MRKVALDKNAPYTATTAVRIWGRVIASMLIPRCRPSVIGRRGKERGQGHRRAPLQMNVGVRLCVDKIKKYAHRGTSPPDRKLDKGRVKPAQVRAGISSTGGGAMPDSVGTLMIAMYGAIVSSATAASQFYQLYRKRRQIAYTFEHNPVRIHDDVGYIDDYVVKAILINNSESELTVLLCQFGIDKDIGRGLPRHNLEAYGRHEKIEFPFVIPPMSAKVVHSFARHWRRDDTLNEIPEADFSSYNVYMVVQIVGEERKCVQIPNAGPALLRHKVVRVRER